MSESRVLYGRTLKPVVLQEKIKGGYDGYSHRPRLVGTEQLTVSSLWILMFNPPVESTSAKIAPASELAQRHWNETPLYLQESERYSAYPWLYEAAEFRNHAGERVLEIGCGTGCDLLQFAKHGAMAVGIDITPEHIRLARERVGNLAQVLHGDGTSIPFQDESFDYVYSHGVLHHLDQPRRMVEEIFRVLRPGGRFNVHVYALWSYWPALLILKHGWNWKLWMENSLDPVHIDLYYGRKVRRLFAPARISLEKFEFKYMRRLEHWLGWFLVAKGENKPDRDLVPIGKA